MEEQSHIASVNVAEELARKDQQLEQLRQAYINLQQQNEQLQQQRNQQQQQEQPLNQSNLMRDNIFKMVNHLPTFTGTGEVTINSFFSSIEYLLSTISDENLKKEVVRIIFYKIIQGQAKDIIINIPTPDNWNVIKETLKLRYRPNVEPHHLYKIIANLKVYSVSELIIELQNIKYKADELIIYYQDDHYIDLSNIDSLLVNTVKEMTQGVLLDKIYEVDNINDILRILTRRRFEDACIRQEYRKFKNTKYDSNMNQSYKNKHNNYTQERIENYNRNNYNNVRKYDNNNNRNNNDRNNNNWNNWNKQFNNSGRYRIPQTNNNYNKTSGNFQRFTQAGHPGPNFNQNRWNQPRQSQTEPMEIDNIQFNKQVNEINYNNQVNTNTQRTAQLGNPRIDVSQYRLTQSRQERNGFFEGNNQREEYDQLAGHSEPDPCCSNMAQPRQSQDQFFSKRPQIFYPS